MHSKESQPWSALQTTWTADYHCDGNQNACTSCCCCLEHTSGSVPLTHPSSGACFLTHRKNNKYRSTMCGLFHVPIQLSTHLYGKQTPKTAATASIMLLCYSKSCWILSFFASVALSKTGVLPTCIHVKASAAVILDLEDWAFKHPHLLIAAMARMEVNLSQMEPTKLCFVGETSQGRRD